MATVLFAVAISMMETRSPIPNSPPLRDLNPRRISCRMNSNPPNSLISAPMEATRMVTIIVSNIPVVPSPIAPIAVLMVREPVISPMIMLRIAPQPRTMNTLMPHSAAISTAKYGMACRTLKSKCSICAPLLLRQRMISRIRVAMAAGSAMRKLALNFSFMAMPWVFVAAIVVSLMNERLSPNMAQPTIVPMHSGRLRCAVSATLMAIGASTVIVPQEVPIAIEMIHAMINSPGTAKLAGMMSSSIYAVLSAPPDAFATPEKAPARRKMNSMIVMLSSPIPFAQAVIFSSKGRSLFCTKATARAIMNATTTDVT